jgi:hypothetical protein
MLTTLSGYSLWISHSGSHLHTKVQDVAVALKENCRLRGAGCVRSHSHVARRTSLWARAHAGLCRHKMVSPRAHTLRRRRSHLRGKITLILRPLGCAMLTASSLTPAQFRVPERFAPGLFDIWLSSHQIFHVSILCAMYMHTIALKETLTASRTLVMCQT